MTGRPPVQRHRLAGRLRAYLATGSGSPDGLLPSERELATRLETSRSALREVLGTCPDLERLPHRGWRRRQARPARIGRVLHLWASADLNDTAVARGLASVGEPCGLDLEILHRPRPRKDDDGPDAELLERLAGCRALVAFTETGLPEPWLRACRDRRVAPICLGANQQLGYDVVCADFSAMSRDLVRAIHGKGHRHIAFCGVRRLHKDNPAFRARVTGYQLAMAEFGLTPEVAYLADDFDQQRRVDDEVDAWLCRLDAEGRRPTCLYVSGNRIVARLSQVLHRLGLRIPTDLSLAGFGVSPDVLHGERRLFTRFLHVDEPWEAIGRATGARLIAMAHGANDPLVTLVPSTLADGDSVLPL